MEKNREVNLTQWVDDRLARLNPGDEWMPNVEGALVRFNEIYACRKAGGRHWAWVAAAAAIACVCLLAFPATREITQHFEKSSHLKMVDVGQVSADVKALKDGEAAPDFTLPDANGVNVRLSAYKGNVVLLNFWATWCGGCQTEIPWLIEFENKYKGSGLVVIGVSMDEGGWKIVKPFLEEKKVNYPVVVGTAEMAKPYGLSSMPMTFLIDRRGKLVATSVGVFDKKACEGEITRLLAR